MKDQFDFNEIIPRSSTLMEFENSFLMKRSNSQDTVLSDDDNRISIASLISVNTAKSVPSLYSIDEQLDENKISYLAFESLSMYEMLQ